jgi:hypothetical protein
MLSLSRARARAQLDPHRRHGGSILEEVEEEEEEEEEEEAAAPGKIWGT